MAVVTRPLDVPASSWGAIIGKGGEKLRELQTEFSVVIRVPRPDAPAGAKVTVRGAEDACSACEERIQQMVQSMGRAKEKQKKPRPQGSAVAGKQPFPAKCALCNADCSSLRSAFEHLGSVRHFASMQDKISDALPVTEAPRSIVGVAALLADPTVGDFHNQLGYDVARLLEAAPAEEARQQAAIALEEEVLKISENFDWLQVQDRTCVRWDATPDCTGTRSMLQAPAIDDMLSRCNLACLPPLVRLPLLPARLPKLDPESRKVNQDKSAHKWPYDPTNRLGIAVALKRQQSLGNFDVICGTSLLKVLSGDSRYVKDKFYVQRHKATLCFLHAPSSFHSQDVPGHAVETLLCGSAGRGSSFHAASSIRIGGYRLLVTSEIDARNELGDLVEIKSSSKKKGMEFIDAKVALQVAVNGSRHVLGCQLDQDKTQLLSTCWVLTSDALQAYKASFIRQGQRVSFFLDRLLKDDCFASVSSPSDASIVMEMTFDDIKAPVLKPAAPGITVLPEGLI